jgi:hypothetical protein
MIPRDIIELWILFILNIIQSQYTYGFPGRRDSSTAYTMDVPGRSGYIYVRIWNGQEITLATALNMGGTPNPNILVRMERRAGILVVVDADPAHALNALGENVAMANVPKHRHFIGSGNEDPVEGRRFVPGLLAPSSAGGLNVHVFPFFTKYGYVAEDSSFTIDDPSTAGTRAWVVVYADSSNVLQYAVSTTHVSGTTGLLDESDIPSEITLPDGATPVGAVVVAAGGSVTNASQFADYRFHFDHNDLFGGLGNVSELTEDTAPNKSADFAITSDVSDSGNPKKVLIHRLNWFRPLSVNVTEVGNVGTGADDLITYSMSGNTLGTNLDRLQIECSGQFAASANNKQLEFLLGDTVLFDSGTLAITNATQWSFKGQIIREGQSVQKYHFIFTTWDGTTAATFVSRGGATEDLSTTLVLKMRGTGTSNNDVVQETMSIDLVRAP